MYRNLHPDSMGITGRQNELIELALTYKFRGLDLDIVELAELIETRGRDYALRFLESADIKVAVFELPVRCAAEQAEFDEDLQKLNQYAELAVSLGAAAANTIVPAASHGRAYHENFELLRDRYGRVAEALSAHNLRLGLGFHAAAEHRESGETFVVKPDALLTLVKTIHESNIGVCLDLWDWHVAGGRPEQFHELSVDQITELRVSDIAADADLETVSDEQRLLPGSTGVVPAAETIQWLSDNNYEGPITPFCHPSQFSGVTRNKIVDQVSAALTALMKRPASAEDESEASEQAAASAAKG